MSCLKVSPFMKQCYVTLTVGINLIGHGAVMGFPAVLLPQLHQKNSTIALTKTGDSWIASVIGITLLIGNFVAAPIMGPLGRKVAHYVISVSAILGWTVTILSNSIEVMIIARIIQGLSFGMMLPLRSILIGEYTSPRNRGAFLTTVSLSQGFGIFFVHFIGAFLSWKYTALVCVFLPFTSLVMTLFTPESPSWLAAKGRYEDCRKEFHWLRGDEENAELEAMIQARIDFDRTNRNGKNLNIMATISKKEFYVPIILMVHINALGQLSGGAVMASYSTRIIRLIMNPDVNAEAWMIGLDAQRIVTNTLAVYIINKVRRRTMMFVTGCLCLGCHVAIVIYVYLKHFGVLNYQATWLPGTLITLQLISVAIGMIPLPSVIAGEVFPLEYRSVAGSISLIAVAGTLFFVLKTFPGLVDSVGIQGTYSVYAGLIAYCMVVIWFLMPETKGKTLQQIEDELTGKTHSDQEMKVREPLNTEDN